MMVTPPCRPRPPAHHWASGGRFPCVRVRSYTFPPPRDLFVYVSPIIVPNALYDLRLTVSQGRDTQMVTVYSLPHFAALIPWNRFHVNLTGDGPITGLSVSVRAEGTSASGQLSFQLEDVGWTDWSDG